MQPLRRLLAGLAALVFVLAGCTAGPDRDWPDPPTDRPVVDLAFAMAGDLASATGTERVRFVPDAQICEVVFRAWPNKPATARRGNSLTVTGLSVDGRELEFTQSAAGAPSRSPGTLVEARLPACSPAGRLLTADLAFDVALGARTDERIGYAPRERVAWLGGAFPLLAWQDGRGWARDRAAAVTGDSATSEVFELRSLAVDAPSADTVVGVGEAAAAPTSAAASASGAGGGRTVHTFSAPVVRDVTFTVGDLHVQTAEVDGTTLVVAVPRRSERADAAAWIAELTPILTRLTDQFGPVPDEHVWVSVLPDVTEGVEFSGAIQFGDMTPGRNRWLLAHELAHLWFYGLVGNNQARDPWLDEAFAVYGQSLVEPTGLLEDDEDEQDEQDGAAKPGGVGLPLAAFAGERKPSEAYVATVYENGGRALLRARQAAGPGAFDEAVRGYLRANAWRVATPADLQAALAELPAALGVLREAGALPAKGQDPSAPAS